MSRISFRQLLIDRRREIEERTLASSERGLGLLYESEKVTSSIRHRVEWGCVSYNWISGGSGDSGRAVKAEGAADEN